MEEWLKTLQTISPVFIGLALLLGIASLGTPEGSLAQKTLSRLGIASLFMFLSLVASEFYEYIASLIGTVGAVIVSVTLGVFLLAAFARKALSKRDRSQTRQADHTDTDPKRDEKIGARSQGPRADHD